MLRSGRRLPTSIIPDHGKSGIGVRANDSDDTVAIGGERKRTSAILKKDNTLTSGIDSELPIVVAADMFGAQMSIRLCFQIAIEHSKAHLNGKSVGQSTINVGFI